ncbi:putative hydroquinone glucosyltransferase [Medicago truncatula]|uniref:Glycosyltransferase n=1 Tax=Medicago truncatula TaxID=3880 RepID=G7KHJ6_MEDTR|nr:hydroquinone glucosyltransferase [Medicago truncatula]AES74408.1 UDP-glucosyltransferase family protein [Medicago truncatula]RHN49750.1 putative hydroquinone glucosyltransferase [Medicago truncatula]
METKTHIALVTVPVYSHLRSILEFTKRLVHLNQNIHVTCINPTFGSSICNNVKSLFESLPSNINYMFLPPINLEDLPKDIHPALKVEATLHRSIPSIYDVLNTLHSSSKLVAVISDGLINEVLRLTKKLDILAYSYFPSTTMLLSLCLHSSNLDKTISSANKDLLEPLEIPGCIPINSTDLPDPMLDRSSEGYKIFLEANDRFYLADGIMINSFLALEETTIRALQEKEDEGIPSIYPIGPFVQNVSCDNGSDLEYLQFLDKQEKKSVLYVSFGSGGTLFSEQIIELAFGLELSGQNFLWVLRPPNKHGVIDDLDSGEYEDEILYNFLPNGFLERTKGKGLVVPYWAPQIEILGHSSIGGFLTHCGWNSTLESVVNGIPIIAWPLFAEQKMNAVLLSDGLKVAIRPKVNENGIVEREEIAKVVKNLMVGEEGKEIHQRMEKLKGNAIDALKENGSSTMTLTHLALKLESLGSHLGT